MSELPRCAKLFVNASNPQSSPPPLAAYDALLPPVEAVAEDVLVSPNSADQMLTSFSVAAVLSLYHLSWSVALANSTLFEASKRASFTVASWSSGK